MILITNLERYPWILIQLFSFILLSTNILSSQTGIDTFYIDIKKSEYDLTDYLYIAEDKQNDIDISEILNEDLVKFDPENQKLNTNSSYWVSFVIASKFESELLIKEWYLYLGNPEYAKVYVFENDSKLIDSLSSGRWTSLKDKSINLGYNKQRVKLSLDFNTAKRFFIHYTKKDNHNHQITPVLKTLDFYQTADNFSNTKRDWSFLGFLLTMIFFNMVFFLSTKDKAFLYHSLFILGIVMFLLDYFNISRNMFFVSEHPILINFINLTAVILFSTSYFLFIRSYLHLSKLFPNWDKLFKLIPYIMFCFMLALILYYYIDFNEKLVDRIAAGGILIIYFISFIFIFPLFKVRDLKVNFLIAGTICIMIGIAFNLYSFIMDNGTWIEMIQLGMTGEIMFFSMGLGFRFKQLKDEEQEAIRIKELNEFKTKVFTNISHEFRTPLTIIQGLSELIKESIEKGSYINIEKNYKTIDRNCNDLLELVNQLLDLSKIESKTYTLKPSLLKLNYIINNTFQAFNSEADKKQIHFEFINGTKDLIFEVDETKLSTVLKNLISNAFKFTPNGGKIIVESSFFNENKINCLLIEVKDSGKGIPKSELPNIFDRFYQAANNTSYIGTGIGLALVKELLELMGGSIKVESEINKGTNFSFTLPITSEQTSHSTLTDNSKDLENKPITQGSAIKIENKPLLLIAEDNVDVLDYLKKILQDKYEILSAENGAIALELAFEHIPDLIVSDVMMPIMNGIQLCNKIKSDDKLDHIPILMLTAKSTMDDKLEGLKTGADAYLTKPFKKEELLIRLENINKSRLKLQKKYSQFALLEKTPELKKENRFIHEVHSIIEEHLEDRNFNVEELANYLHMSRMQLHRKIKAISGKSASNYVRSYRLYKAKPILEDLSLSISEIAWKVGFQDPNYFTKSFIKEFGITPTEFRQKISE